MKTGQKGLDLIKHFEQFRGDAYQDSVGVWTIGYGRIKGVKSGDTCTLEQAEAWLAEELDHEYEGYVNKYVTVPLTQDQFDGLVAWVYNLGGGALRSSTLLKRLNASLYDEVPFQMKRWNKAGGKVLRGLVRRRCSEALLFETGEANYHPDGWDD
jgi:lysozyme